MSKSSASNWLPEDHPKNWYQEIEGMRALALGTFPPYIKRRKFEFYYPNSQNRFWRILAHLAGKPLLEKFHAPAVEERQELMRFHRLGVENMGESIQRLGTSSRDRDIRITKYHDILGIIKRQPKLKVIILSGFYDEMSTYRTFVRYLGENNINLNLPQRVTAGFRFELPTPRPTICVVTNSTSSLAARKVSFEDLVKQFRAALDLAK